MPEDPLPAFAKIEQALSSSFQARVGSVQGGQHLLRSAFFENAHLCGCVAVESALQPCDHEARHVCDAELMRAGWHPRRLTHVIGEWLESAVNIYVTLGHKGAQVFRYWQTNVGVSHAERV